MWGHRRPRRAQRRLPGSFGLAWRKGAQRQNAENGIGTIAHVQCDLCRETMVDHRCLEPATFTQRENALNYLGLFSAPSLQDEKTEGKRQSTPFFFLFNEHLTLGFDS